MNSRWNDVLWKKSMRIRVDYRNVLTDVVGVSNGLSHKDLEYISAGTKKAHDSLAELRKKKLLGFTELPYQDEIVEDILGCAGRLKQDFDSFVVVGIGGSALVSIALQTALNPPFYNELPSLKRNGGLKVYFPDNIDPDLIRALINTVNIEKTVFNIITKSGSTAETLANFLIIRDEVTKAVGEQKAHEHFVFTTDPDHGFLRKLARSGEYRTFAVPANVGGRFSVLSPVGLLSAVTAGIDIEELLAGAAFMDDVCSNSDIFNNPAAMLAAVHYLMYQKGKNIAVMMPYVQALKDVADWFRQLWAESLGKKCNNSGREVHVGQTPVKALGATDQHSQLQLYVEGPNDKMITFVTVERYAETVTINCPYTEEAALNYLDQRSLNELLQTEQKATAWSLSHNQHPNCRIILPEINPFTVGQLLYMLQLQTAYAGELFQVNAFDQPGVEEGKKATYALMGRTGYDHMRNELSASIDSTSDYII